MRADVNISIREAGSETLGTRTEMKNLNSFKAITRAIEGETKRQIELLEEGRRVIQETRRWDDNKEYSYAMRSKEDAKDYRYFPDPDLPPIYIDDEWCNRVKNSLPELQPEKMRRFQERFGLSEYDSRMITESRSLAELFEKTANLIREPKKAANWLIGETGRLLKEREMEPEAIRFSPEHLAALIRLTEDGSINNTTAKEVFGKMFDNDIDPEQYVNERGLLMVNDEGALQDSVEAVLNANPKTVEEYLGGKTKVLGFLVGQVMKQMRGKANPEKVSELLAEQLRR